MKIEINATSATKQDKIAPGLEKIKPLLIQSISKSLADYLGNGCQITDLKLSVAVDDIEAITEPVKQSNPNQSKKRRRKKGRRRKK